MSNNKKYSVLQVLPHLNSGGLVSGAIEVSSALVKNNFQSYVLSEGGRREREIDRDGGVLLNLNVGSKNPIIIYKNIFKLKKIIEEFKIDIIHARSRAPAWSAYYAAKKTKTPFVTTFHGTYGIKNNFKKKYNSIMIRSNRVIAISNFIKDHIIENYNINNDKIITIQRGINISDFNSLNVTDERLIAFTNKFNIPEDSLVILLPGRLTRWKGHELFIKAIAKLNRKDILCLFVGDNQGRKNYLRDLKKLIENYKLTNNFRIIDNQLDMAAVYKLSDVVVSASTDPEAFGRVVAEAQAMGRPTITANHGGAPEIILDGVTGWLFKPNDIEDLAEKISIALNINKSDRDKIALQSNQRIKMNFDNNFMCNKTLNLYKELINRQTLDEKKHIDN
tara:strand:- start:1733 stop:2908 length:1176 start_codon:yes stop_codon:yes gene_type:complete